MSGLLLVAIAIAPSVALLYYIYNKDRYEKEPRRLLIRAFVLGIIIVIPVAIIEVLLSKIFVQGQGMTPAFYQGFVVAGLTEETFKFLALYKGFYRNPEFDERFDGIVYSVFLSLGFATLENILYVAGGGMGVGLFRAVTAVPAHALFGVAMGYYFGRARFATPKRAKSLLLRAVFVPFLLHGIYDFILMSGNPILLLAFLPYLVYMWRRGLQNIKELDMAKDVLLAANYHAHQYAEPLPEGQTIEEHMAFEYHPNNAEANIYPEDVDVEEIYEMQMERREEHE